MGRKILTGLVGLAGFGIVALALLAQKIGLARSNAWGFGRQLMLGVGLAFLLLFGVILTYGFWNNVLQKIGKAARRLADAWQRLPGMQKLTSALRAGTRAVKSGWDRLPPVRWLRSTRLARYFAESQERQAALAAACLAVMVVTVYVFYVSVGRWTDWPKNTNYYDQLAQAFSHGQPYLLQAPDPALAGLSDPYDFDVRGSIHVLWDASYYHGKYYLNWGPAPALVLMVAHLFTSQPIGDEVLVFSFVTGAFLFSSLLILGLRKRLFPALNWKYVLPAILIAGFANPLPWILNRPAVYEAAVSGGQFFLLGGLFFAFTAFDRQSPGYWKLVLASLFWVLAMTSRSTLAVAVGFLVAMTCLYLFLRVDRRQVWKYILTMGLLMGAALAGMLWYNKIRFDSWFEFGLRYLLTGVNFHKYYSEAWSLGNFLPNFNSYLINPFRTLTIFPYVKPDWGGHLVLFYIKAPPHYSPEQVSGLIPTLPFSFCAFIPLVYLFLAGWRRFGSKSGSRHAEGSGFGLEYKEWTFLTLGGASFLAFLPILFYISNNMRYLIDGVPMLVLLSILGFWQGAEALARRPALRGMFVLLVILLVAYSVLVSLLLAITGNEARFEHLNPVLFENLTHWLTP